jgi:DNA-binding protein HU-beta
MHPDPKWRKNRFNENMSVGKKDIPKELQRVLELGEFRKLNNVVVPTHFGNELETYGSPSMQLRLVKDRDQWSIDLGPADLSGEWYHLQDVLSVVGSNEGITSFDLDVLAEALLKNFPKIQQLFANYSSNRSALKHATASESNALMDEIFSGVQDGGRAAAIAKNSKQQRGPLTKVSLVEAVQKQLGSETSKAEAERAVTAVINAVKVGVKKNKMVKLVGFGTFKVVERKARKIVNPKTHRKISTPKSKTVKFVPSKDLNSEAL